MPDRATLDAIRHLADAQADWHNRHTGLARQISQADMAIARRRQRMASLRAAGHDVALHADSAPFSGLVAEMKRLEMRAATLDRRQADLAAWLRDAGSGHGGRPARHALPPPEGARMAAERQHHLRTEYDRLDAACTTERARQARLAAELARLEQTGSPLAPACWMKPAGNVTRCGRISAQPTSTPKIRPPVPPPPPATPGPGRWMPRLPGRIPVRPAAGAG
ncbi:hypothetical protein RAA17_11380 [Komagataeibacter rhaeticus]|nr:hypothetical protein [Komagataeibacter rhaeticus]